MNFGKGIKEALFWTVAGVVFTFVAVFALTIIEIRRHPFAEGFDQQFLEQVFARAIFPMIGVGAYLGAAAWATYAPVRTSGFVKNLLLVFLIGCVTTVIWAEILSQLFPFADRNERYHWIVAVVIALPPVVIANLIVVARLYRDWLSRTT